MPPNIGKKHADGEISPPILDRMHHAHKLNWS